MERQNIFLGRFSDSKCKAIFVTCHRLQIPHPNTLYFLVNLPESISWLTVLTTFLYCTETGLTVKGSKKHMSKNKLMVIRKKGKGNGSIIM